MDIVLRALVVYLFVLVLTRAVGRRELSTLEPFDLILLVMIGDLVQQGVTQNDFSVTGSFLAVGTIGVLTVIFSYLPWRFHILRPVLEGVPIILVEDGNVVEKNLRRQPLDTGGDRCGRARGEHRVALAGALGGPRDERADQLHQEGRQQLGHGRVSRRTRSSKTVHVAKWSLACVLVLVLAGCNGGTVDRHALSLPVNAQ